MRPPIRSQDRRIAYMEEEYEIKKYMDLFLHCVGVKRVFSELDTKKQNRYFCMGTPSRGDPRSNIY